MGQSPAKEFSSSDRAEDLSEVIDVTPPMLEAGTVFAGRYEIGDPLGVGGYAVVYSAFDRQLRTDVAIKILRADRLSASTVRRFRREVLVARETQSERLVRIFDIGESDGTLFLTMERVAGCLRDELETQPLPIERAVDVTRGTLEALAVLHGVGIVHRDIKPENILVAADGSIKLADFGLARHTERPDGTQTDALVGTFEYISPEQALGKPLDARSDLYSLGVLLFEMLTGELPYSSRTSVGALLAHVQQRPHAIHKLRSGVPPWLAAMVARLLEKDVRRRYQSAGEVAADLDRQRVRPAWRTRRGLAVASLLAMICGTVGLSTWLWNDYQSSRFHTLSRDVAAFRGLDRMGRVLWEHRGPSYEQVAVARLLPEGKPVIVKAESHADKDVRSVANHTVAVLDPQTGNELRRIQFPVRSHAFPAFSDTFVPDALLAADLNGDGWDEVAISYAHYPYYPSYTTVLDGRTGKFTDAIQASGRHAPVGALDVDGDGRRELIVMGPNNRMGWYGGIAAIRISDHPSEVQFSASTPDIASVRADEALLWYALVPAGAYSRRRLIIDPDARELRLTYASGRVLTLTADGFVKGTPGNPEIRQRARRAAHNGIRATTRLLESGAPADALASAEEAIENAREAGESPLVEWATRLRVRALIQLGRYDEAEAAFETLRPAPTDAANATWDTARAYHMTGRTADAVRWYRRGYVESDDFGRLKYEYLQGIVLALAEHARWREAKLEIERYAGTMPNDSEPEWCQRFVEWRSTGKVERLPLAAPITDVHRYWELEFRLAQGEPAKDVLAKLDAVASATSEVGPLLQSVKAELFAREGRRREAAGLARTALRDAEAAGAYDPILRGHVPALRERAARLAREESAR